MSDRRPDIEAIRKRYDEGFPSNATDEEIARELWQSVGALLDYITELEGERKHHKMLADAVEPFVAAAREYARPGSDKPMSPAFAFGDYEVTYGQCEWLVYVVDKRGE